MNFLRATKATRSTSAHVDGARPAGAFHGYLGEGLTHFIGSACSLPGVDRLNAGMLGDAFMQILAEMQVHAQLAILMYVHHYTHTCIHMEGHLCIHKAVYPHAHTYRHCPHVHEPVQT